MSQIQLKDLRFSFPDEWHDRTIVAVSAVPDPGWGVTPNFVVSRDQAKPGETLDSYADRQLIELAKKLEEFRLFGRKPVTVGGVAGVELLSTWKGGEQVVAQQHRIVMRSDYQIFSFVCTASKDEFRKVSGIFDGILATVSF